MADPINDALADMFPDTVTVQKKVTDWQGNESNSGVAFTVPCRIQEAVAMVRDPDGKERASRVRLIVNGVYGLKTTYEYTLPARFDPQKMEAIAVEPVSDENGPHHEVVRF
jgi:hypothetical protein